MRRLDPWFYDNGAFEDWRAGRPFDELKFMGEVETMSASDDKPDFIVLPDLPGQGQRSAELSISWIDRLAGVAPLFFAAQDGMSANDVPWDRIDGMFLGGTLEWKVRHALAFADAAKANGRPAHYGRCGTKPRVMSAFDYGYDSLDSSLPLWSNDNMRRFMDTLAQERLFS